MKYFPAIEDVAWLGFCPPDSPPSSRHMLKRSLMRKDKLFGYDVVRHTVSKGSG
jgi:hypothetical protein